MEMQVGFTWFAEWWRVDNQIKEEKERAKHGGRRPSDRVKGEREAREERDKERAQIQAAYDQYKTDLQIRMARSFVQQHKGEEWFKERYVPEIRDPIRQRLMDFRKAPYEQWEKDMEKGLFDEFTLEGIYKNDSDGAGGVIEKEEGEATGVGEVLGVLDLVAARGGDLRDDSAQQPALLIKTLAPNVSREKVEDFCKEHLGEGEGGFRWLSLSDPNPTKKCHRIGWIMLHPGGEEDEVMQEVERGDGREEEGEDGEEDNSKILANGNSGKTPAQRALELVNEKVIADPVRGDFTCHVGVHNPPNAPRKKALWDLFSAPERVERDLELARRLTTKLEADFGQIAGEGGLAKINRRVEYLQDKGFLQPATSLPAKAKKNAFVDNDDEIKFEDEVEEGEEDEGTYDEEVDDEELIVAKKKLDLIVEYLRRVFNFCFFCVFESDSIHELVRKCPGGHLRRPRAGLNNTAKAAAKASALGQPFPSRKKENAENGDENPSPIEERRPPKFQNKTDQQLLRAFNWVKTFEDKILQLLEPEYVDLKKLGGRPVEEALEEELAKFVKQEDESKFRCKVPECTKLFKAEHFWRKHVEKRHDDWYRALKADVCPVPPPSTTSPPPLTNPPQLQLVNAYVLDPSHIAPSRSDANSNGHFPVPNNHMPAGTPRGFNLQNMMSFGQNGMNGMAAFQGGGGVGPPFMSAAGMGPPGYMGSAAMQLGIDNMSGMHNPGVMRKGGNRFNQRSGPYDRRGGGGGGGGARNGYMGGGGGGGGSTGFGGAGTLPGPGSSVMRILPGAGMGFVAQGGGGGGGKWGDGAGGGMPREAVQGRSIKSYEDLDAQPSQGGAGMGAAGGNGGAELDY
jgi:uncharacterized C2H2 Zn-finger protein